MLRSERRYTKQTRDATRDIRNVLVEGTQTPVQRQQAAQAKGFGVAIMLCIVAVWICALYPIMGVVFGVFVLCIIGARWAVKVDQRRNGH
jgi:Flp pilus assembly protein TadB